MAAFFVALRFSVSVEGTLVYSSQSTPAPRSTPTPSAMAGCVCVLFPTRKCARHHRAPHSRTAGHRHAGSSSKSLKTRDNKRHWASLFKSAQPQAPLRVPLLGNWAFWIYTSLTSARRQRTHTPSYAQHSTFIAYLRSRSMTLALLDRCGYFAFIPIRSHILRSSECVVRDSRLSADDARMRRDSAS